MTIKTTRWAPDTCGCEIEYTWDDSVSDNERTHILENYVKRCSIHASLPSDTDRWNTILEENPRKNLTLKHILDNAPTTLFDTIDGARQLKNGISYNFSLTGVAPNRVLNISFTGISLTSQQKNTLQTLLDSRFGAGKVVLS